MFSKACEYAIRAVLYIAIKSPNGQRLGLKQIAKEVDSPIPFTAKILQTLSRKGIIASTKGPNGGFYLKPKSKPVSLGAIVRAIDGSDTLHMCAIGLKECSDRYPCPIHEQVKAYKDSLRLAMNEKTVKEMAKDLGEGRTFLKNRQRKIK